MIECKTLRPADYLEILQRMRQFSESRGAATPDALWQVEHSPVFTLGQAGQERHILDAGDIPIVRTERGGQVTYHGPGQVVVYTLIDIRRRGLFVKDFVCRLEQALIDTLSDYGITQAQRKSNAPGVYVAYQGELAKIAALGLKVSRGKTYHGVALNLQMNLEPFSRINPCGYPGIRTVDMDKMVRALDWQQVADRLCHRVNEQLTK
jgi:lipoyl(octanoyl) transferase